MIKAGKYRANVFNHDLREKNEKVFCIVTFKLIESGELINWFGSFSEKASEYTVKQLTVLGFKSEDVFDLVRLKDNGEIAPIQMNTGKTWELVIENTPNLSGVIGDRVRYINDPEAPRVAAGLSRESMRARLPGFSIKADVMKIANESDDIPF